MVGFLFILRSNVLQHIIWSQIYNHKSHDIFGRCSQKWVKWKLTWAHAKRTVLVLGALRRARGPPTFGRRVVTLPGPGPGTIFTRDRAVAIGTPSTPTTINYKNEGYYYHLTSKKRYVNVIKEKIIPGLSSHNALASQKQ